MRVVFQSIRLWNGFGHSQSIICHVLVFWIHFIQTLFWLGNNLCIPFLWSLPTSLLWVHPQSAISQILLVNNRTSIAVLHFNQRPKSSLVFAIPLPARTSINFFVGQRRCKHKNLHKVYDLPCSNAAKSAPKFCYHSFLCSFCCWMTIQILHIRDNSSKAQNTDVIENAPFVSLGRVEKKGKGHLKNSSMIYYQNCYCTSHYHMTRIGKANSFWNGHFQHEWAVITRHLYSAIHNRSKCSDQSQGGMLAQW